MRIPLLILWLAAAACSEPSAAPLATKRRYLSDCSTTHPIARDTCAGKPLPTRGLKSCASIGVKAGQACTAKSPSCYLDRLCADGHRAVSDYLICATEQPSACFTRSSARYKHDIRYLAPTERDDLVRRIHALPLARYHYTDEIGGRERLGFITEDAPQAPFVADDGTAIDLYALLAATIATVQDQEQRIQTLERRLDDCGPRNERPSDDLE